MSVTVIGIDVGGTGARAAISRDGAIIAAAEGPRDGLQNLVETLLARTGLTTVDAVAVGATGFQMLGEQMRATVPAMLRTVCGPAVVLLSSDTITSYAGALGLQPGAVIAAGTGAVAFGSDLRGTWLRVDGWGHLLGDDGGGSWIGRRGMQAALRAVDGRPDGSPALETALRERFGSPAELVADLTGRSDRAAVMAGFVPAVVAAADSGDPIAVSILEEAGRQLAETALAALPEGEHAIAATGNLFRAGVRLWNSFTARIGDLATVKTALGSGVDGALLLAVAAYQENLPKNAPVELYR